MNYIEEIYALPIGLRPVAKCNGIPLYGSDSLNQKFIMSMKNNIRTKDIGKTLEKMVLNKMIIPCFADAGLISYFRRRISKDSSGGLMSILKLIVFAPSPIKHPLDFVLAFYDFDDNRIVVLISNHLLSDKLFDNEIADLAIAKTLTHELMHFYAHSKPTDFIKTFRNELTAYYSTYFTKIFKLNGNKQKENVIEELYNYLFFKYEMLQPSKLNTNHIFKILKQLEKYSNLKKDEFKKVLNDFIMLTNLLNENHTNLPKIIPLLKKQYLHLIKPLFASYRGAFGKLPNKGCTQEVYYPSEVVCGFSDINFNSKVKSAINSTL